MFDTTSRHERMAALNEVMGMTLRHLQTLEGSVAQFWVLTEKAERGMGEEKANALLAKAQRETFGTNVKKLKASKNLPEDVVTRLDALAKERNWLVHNSLEENRKATLDDDCLEVFALRLEAMVIETQALMKGISAYAEKFAMDRGCLREEIEAKTAETLKQWRG